MKKFLSVCLCLCGFVFFKASAQITFQRTYGGNGSDEGRCVKQTWDGGYIIAGSTSSFGVGVTDVYLLKVDSFGNMQWQKTFGGNNIDRGYSLDITSDSGYVICGSTNSFGFGGYDAYLIRTDQNGDTLWTKTYGGIDWDFGNSVQQTNDGGFIIAGGTYSFGNGDEDVYIIKTNSLGDTLWTKAYGGSNQDEAKSIKQTVDGGYVFCGFTKSFADINGDVYIVKTNASGNIIWSKAYGGGNTDEAADIVESANGDFIIIGGTKSFSQSGFDVYNLRTDLNGDTLWTRVYGADSLDNYGTSLVEMPSGKFAFSDYTEGIGGGSRDFHLFVSHQGGFFMNGATYGGSGNDEPYSIDYCSDNGFVMCGYSESFNVNKDVFLVKTDSVGVSLPYNAVEEFFITSGEINVYPNPVQSSFIHVSIPADISDLDVIVSDISGRVLINQYFKNIYKEISLPVDELARGTYFIQVQSQHKIIGYARFLNLK